MTGSTLQLLSRHCPGDHGTLCRSPLKPPHEKAGSKPSEDDPTLCETDTDTSRHPKPGAVEHRDVSRDADPPRRYYSQDDRLRITIILPL
eukprot:scaffold2334_cov97-Skeletonema_dohrnii-CCMP3373.AAC.3